MLLQIAVHAPPATLDETVLKTVSTYLSERGHSATEAFLAELASRHSDAQPQPATLLWGQAQQALHTADTARAADLLQQLGADWPLHPLRAQALPLQAQLAQEADAPAQERQHWQALLAHPASSPALRAQALLALARLHTAAGELPAAINHYQRLYTLYRAQQEAATRAYMESALLFEALGQGEAASATYKELLHSKDLHVPEAIREQAQAAQNRLLANTDAVLTPVALPALASPPAQAPSSVASSAQPPTPAIGLATSAPSPPALLHTALSDTTQPSGATSRHTGATPHLRDTSSSKPHPVVPLEASLQQEAPLYALTGEGREYASPPQATPAFVGDPEWLSLLRAPAQVQLVYGDTLWADILGIENALLHLRLREADRGIGEIALPLERVLRIDFADAPIFAHTDHLEASGQAALAYARRKELYALREKALPFVSEATQRRFADLAHQALQQSEPLLAARIARRSLDAHGNLAAQRKQPATDTPESPRFRTPAAVQATPRQSFTNIPKPHQDALAHPFPNAHSQITSYPAIHSASPLQTQLADAELLALWQLNLREQAVALAATRLNPDSPVHTTDAPASALPHALLAMNALANADADAALELALHPIALHASAQQATPPYLAVAYAVALEAAVALQQETVQQQLQAEAAAKDIAPVNPLRLDHSFEN